MHRDVKSRNTQPRAIFPRSRNADNARDTLMSRPRAFVLTRLFVALSRFLSHALHFFLLSFLCIYIFFFFFFFFYARTFVPERRALHATECSPLPSLFYEIVNAESVWQFWPRRAHTRSQLVFHFSRSSFYSIASIRDALGRQEEGLLLRLLEKLIASREIKPRVEPDHVRS